MTSLRFLHFSDLHIGQKEARYRWQEVRWQLYKDLSEQSKISGPWDVVLFTGDLTYSAAASEFTELTKVLTDLWDHLKKDCKSDPILLAVPGNHDCRLPNPKEPVVRALSRWYEEGEEELKDVLWDKEFRVYQEFIKQCFRPFASWLEKWMKKHPSPGRESYCRGDFGDFSAQLRMGGTTIGILGLNSALVQLALGNYEKKLLLDVRQAHDCCNQDGFHWLGQNTLNLLMTHHPPDWLHPKALPDFRKLSAPELVNLHLCGHMHEGYRESIARNGFPVEHRIQGSSLFGIERSGRIHGYGAGHLKIMGNKAVLQHWPRRLYGSDSIHGQLHFKEDHELKLKDGYQEIQWDLRRGAAVTHQPNAAAPAQDAALRLLGALLQGSEPVVPLLELAARLKISAEEIRAADAFLLSQGYWKGGPGDNPARYATLEGHSYWERVKP